MKITLRNAVELVEFGYSDDYDVWINEHYKLKPGDLIVALKTLYFGNSNCIYTYFSSSFL